MKMKTIILSITALLLFSSMGCQKYEDPAPYTPLEMTANMSIKQFKTLYVDRSVKIPSYDATILVGKVISTDRYGNFYRSFYIQDTVKNGSAIEIKVGLTGMYNDYKIGQMVYVKPAGLCLGRYGGMISLGYPTSDRYENGYIDIPAIIKRAIFRGIQSTPIAPVNITKASDITENLYGCWVTLKGATYMGGSYYINNTTTDPWDKWAKKPATLGDDTAYGEQQFLLADGNTIVVVRTSGYAKFADNKVPFNVGEKANVTGVLTKYINPAGTRTTIQLILNTDADVVAAQ